MNMELLLTVLIIGVFFLAVIYALHKRKSRYMREHTTSEQVATFETTDDFAEDNIWTSESGLLLTKLNSIGNVSWDFYITPDGNDVSILQENVDTNSLPHSKSEELTKLEKELSEKETLLKLSYFIFNAVGIAPVHYDYAPFRRASSTSATPFPESDQLFFRALSIPEKGGARIKLRVGNREFVDLLSPANVQLETDDGGVTTLTIIVNGKVTSVEIPAEQVGRFVSGKEAMGTLVNQ